MAPRRGMESDDPRLIRRRIRTYRRRYKDEMETVAQMKRWNNYGPESIRRQKKTADFYKDAAERLELQLKANPEPTGKPASESTGRRGVRR